MTSWGYLPTQPCSHCPPVSEKRGHLARFPFQPSCPILFNFFLACFFSPQGTTSHNIANLTIIKLNICKNLAIYIHLLSNFFSLRYFYHFLIFIVKTNTGAINHFWLDRATAGFYYTFSHKVLIRLNAQLFNTFFSSHIYKKP